LAIEGDGFFAVQTPNGETAYTRNGSLLFAIASDGLALTNSEGYPLLDTTGTPIVLPGTTDVSKISIDVDGKVIEAVDEPYTAADGTTKYNTKHVERAQLGIVQFNNPSGLLKVSGSMYQESLASGEPRMEVEDEALKRSAIRSGYLEASNVQTVDEIVNLIVAQRAYEMNSKVITASDQMLQQANNLRG